jgi:hypothetical protein
MSAVAPRQRPGAIRVEVVFWRQKGEFVGHCLQFDIVAVGQTLEKAADTMRRLIVAHVRYVDENDNWDHLYRPAPAEVWQRLAEASRREKLPRWTPREATTAIEWMADQTRVTTHFAFV